MRALLIANLVLTLIAILLLLAHMGAFAALAPEVGCIYYEPPRVNASPPDCTYTIDP